MRSARLCLIAAVAVPCGALAAQQAPTRPYTVALASRYLPLESVRDGIVRMPSALARIVSVHRDSVLLQQVLLDIATQAGLGLSYGEDVARSATRVSLDASRVSAADALARAVKGTPWAVLVNAAGQVSVVSADERRLGVVSGRVTDRATGAPVVGAAVLLDGTRLGVTVGEDGRFRIANVPAGDYRVTARRIGYLPLTHLVSVADDSTAATDFALVASATMLNEVVITGVPLATSRRTIGNAITTVDAAAVSDQTATTTVSELLAARAPGVSVLSSSGTPGTSGTIRIRGTGSLASTSDPVVYVDGVRISSGVAGNFRNSYESPSAALSARQSGGGQDASLLGNLSPEEVESIEVIKGPAAATLYGADAANGVIQIITKKGRTGEQKPQWRAKLQSGRTDWGLGRRTNYTTCSADNIALQLPNGGAAFPGCQGLTPGSRLSYSGLDNPGVLRAGQLDEYVLSLTGGGKGYSYFTAVDRNAEQGVVTNSESALNSARANFSVVPNDKVTYGVNLSYSRAEIRFPMGDNGTNLLESAWTYQPGTPVPNGQAAGFAAGAPVQFDVYDNRIRTDRVTAGTTTTFNPASWFHNRLTVGADVTNALATRFIAPGSLWAPNEGQLTQGEPRNTVYTIDYAGTIATAVPFAPGLTSALSFGTQYTNRQYRNTIAQGNNFASASTKDINLSAVRSGWSEYLDVKSLGIFAQEQVGWADKLFVTGALRVDNSSVFGSQIKQLYYPKVSLSYVISEEPFISRLGLIDELKLRAAYGQAGNAPDPFAGIQSYTSVVTIDANGNRVPSLVLNSKGNPDVKPERGEEIELGFDAALFHSRVGAELTYYNKTTRDALMLVPNAPSEGFPGGTFQNLGEISNRGFELGLTATPVRLERVTWDSRLNLSTNRNRLVRFGYPRGPIITGLTAMNQRYAEGYPLGGFWVHGAPILDAATNTYSQNPAVRFVGSADPTREISSGNTVTLFKRFHLYGLLDYKGGFYVTNQTDQRRCAARVCAAYNDPNLSAEDKRLLLLDIGTNDAPWTQKGDFLKLRDLSLTYDLPNALFTRVGASHASLQVAGHNLAILWTDGYTGLDPEVNFSGTNGPTGAFGLTRVDYWTMPQTRRYTASIDLTF
jgi:TonB-dependent starch-binding outer membrane protein SusC